MPQDNPHLTYETPTECTPFEKQSITAHTKNGKRLGHTDFKITPRPGEKGHKAYINHIAVKRDHQGQGIGKDIYRAMCKLFKDHCNEVKVEKVVGTISTREACKPVDASSTST